MTECNEEPMLDWQRRWNIGMILRHNARHPDDPTPLPLWITESSDNYATLKRPLPETKTDKIYIYDQDYRCDPWDQPTIYDINKLSFKIQVPNPQKPPEEIHTHHTHATYTMKFKIGDYTFEETFIIMTKTSYPPPKTLRNS